MLLMNNQDRNAIANDWKAVGGDIRSVVENRYYQNNYNINLFNAVIRGIRTLNPFGTNTR